MTMSTFNQISQLRRNADEFATFWARYNAHTAKTDIDKYGAGFGGDSRFCNFKVATFFESHSGSYGSSSCYTFGRFDERLASEYMVLAMNCLREELFAKCAELMRADAAKKVAAARQEVALMSAALDAVLSDAEATTPPAHVIAKQEAR